MNYAERIDALVDKAEKEPCHRKRYQAYDLAHTYAIKSQGNNGRLLYHLAHEAAKAKKLWMDSTEPDARDPELAAAMHADDQQCQAMAAREALRKLDEKVLAAVLKYFKADDAESRIEAAAEEYRVRLLKAML